MRYYTKKDFEYINDPKISMPESQTPTYQKILEHFRGQIVSGELQPDDVLPTEQKIAEEWEVSRGTVSKAMSFLKQEGWVSSQRSRGTTVNSRQPAIHGIMDRFASVRQAATHYGDKGTVDTTSAGFAPAPENVAVAFKIEEGEEVVRRSRQRHYEGTPVTMSVSWHPAHHANAIPHLLIPKNMDDGLARVEKATGDKIGTLSERVAAMAATQEHADFFGFKLPDAVLTKEHTWWDTNNKPFCFGESWYKPLEWFTYNIDVSTPS